MENKVLSVSEADSAEAIENANVVPIADREWECTLCSIYIVGAYNIKVQLFLLYEVPVRFD